MLKGPSSDGLSKHSPRNPPREASFRPLLWDLCITREKKKPRRPKAAGVEISPWFPQGGTTKVDAFGLERQVALVEAEVELVSITGIELSNGSR